MTHRGGRTLDQKIAAYDSNFGDAFSTTKAYAIGEYCIYLNRLYRFTATKSAGAWDSSKVDAVNVVSEGFNALKRVYNVDITEYIRNNAKNRSYISFVFWNVENNPFSINSGVIMVFRNTTLTSDIIVLAFNGNTFETKKIKES